jgi:hypothetical protein
MVVEVSGLTIDVGADLLHDDRVLRIPERERLHRIGAAQAASPTNARALVTGFLRS